MTENFTYRTTENEEIKFTLYQQDSFSQNPLIICVHGFKGFKDWGFWPFIGEYFSANGFSVVTLNFSHNGIEDNPFEISNYEKFANNTFSLEVNELKEIIHAAATGKINKIKPQKIGLLGHSRGGAESLLAAVNNSEITSIVTLSAIAKLDRFTKRQKAEWRKNKFWEVVNSRTGQIMKLNVTILEDIEKNKNGSLNLESAVRNLQKPYLILHGTEDLTVPISEAETIYSWSDKKLTEFIRVENCGHTFNIQHPFAETNEKFSFAMSKTLEFFNRTLK